MRAKTWSDKLPQGRKALGRAIAPLIGMNYDEAQAEADRGHYAAMMPFARPDRGLSKPAQALIDSGAARLVEDHAALAGNHALFIDDWGNVLRLTGDDHGEALIQAGLATPKTAYGPQVLAENRLIRGRTITGGQPEIA